MASSEPTVEQRSARSTIWARRRAAVTAKWRTFLQNRQGRIGLMVLAFFVLIAIIVMKRTVLLSIVSGLPIAGGVAGYLVNGTSTIVT